jgi:hypothetical protein
MSMSRGKAGYFFSVERGGDVVGVVRRGEMVLCCPVFFIGVTGGVGRLVAEMTAPECEEAIVEEDLTDIEAGRAF